MEITLDTIINIGGWLLGGGSLGGLLTWRFTRRKANADAISAEAEAEKKKSEAEQELQDYYKHIIDDIANDRDYYKHERDELRARLDSMEEQVRGLQREVARNGIMLDSLRHFMCADFSCKHRKRVTMSEICKINKVEKKDYGNTDKQELHSGGTVLQCNGKGEGHQE